MKNIILFLIIFVFACEQETIKPVIVKEPEPVEVPPVVPHVVVPKVILYTMMGQSNSGNLSQSVFEDKVSKGVKGWDLVNKKWVDSLSAQQTMNNSYSPLIPVSIELRKRDTVNQLYFMVFHRGTTNLFADWSPTRPSNLQLFRNGCDHMDAALAQMPKPDSIIFLWLQGERDGRDKQQAERYQINERFLFDTLDARYGIDKFINYIPRTTFAYKDLVTAAKEANAAADPKIKLIYVPDTEQYYVYPHMNKTGILYYTNEVVNFLKP